MYGGSDGDFDKYVELCAQSMISNCNAVVVVLLARSSVRIIVTQLDIDLVDIRPLNQ